MIDVPQMVDVKQRDYQPGPFSVIAQQGTHVKNGKYDDQKLVQQREHFDGHGHAYYNPGAAWQGRAISAALGGPRRPVEAPPPPARSRRAA
jgi:hypothetical protein